MGVPFRIGLKDRALVALMKGGYRKGLVGVFLLVLLVLAFASVLAAVAALVVRTIPWFLPLMSRTLDPVLLRLEPFSWLLGPDPVAPGFSGVMELIAVQGFLAMLVVGSLIGSLILFVLPVRSGLKDLFRMNRDGSEALHSILFAHVRKRSYLRSVRTFGRLLIALLPSLAPGAAIALAAMTFVAVQYGTDAERWVPPITLRADSFAALVLPVLLALSIAFLGFIPAILRGVAYRPVAWVLGAMPDLTPREVIRLSERMTRGRRMDLFLVDLSFLGWFVLALSTCGLGFPFLAPYYEAVQAEAFARLVEESIAAGFLVRRSRSNRTDPAASHTVYP